MRYNSWRYLLRYPEDLLAGILKSRNIKDSDKFLNINYENLTPTSTLNGIKKASDKILSAISLKHKIAIFCDYDADGVCSGAIILRSLSLLGAEAIYYVPERSEGYSLNNKAIDYFVENSVKLVITLDCGIKNPKEVELLKKNGIETIIVDHHQLPKELPKAFAIVHPDITSDNTNLELSGGGTAYMLTRELLSNSGQEKWLIDLAAISSVADVVPLNNDNRILVKYGLQVLEKTRNEGLKKLLEVSGLNNKVLSTYDLGFMIAPRLNAAGRIAHPKDSLELLIETDEKKVSQLAKKLDDFNKSRQEILLKSVEEAISVVEKESKAKDNVILVKGQWDDGIVGLIASKLTDKYYRPSIILSEKGDFLKGSARSIEGVNITDLISGAEKLLISFGGHSQAAGVSLPKDNFDKFEEMIKFGSKDIAKKLFLRKLKVDALVNLNDLTMESVSSLELLAPFGPGNPRPVLAIEKVLITGFELIGKDKSHMKVHFESKSDGATCLVFSFENKDFKIEEGKIFDIAFTACINEFNGRRKIDLTIEDAKEIK